MHNINMINIFLQLIKANLLLLILCLNIYASAESYDEKEYIYLSHSICKNATKYLTLEDSDFFEYIGAGESKIFECGKSTEAGNEPCRQDPELICRNINKKHILQRSDYLLISASKFLTSTKKVKSRKKLERTIKAQTKTNKQWASSNDILSLIDSLEREIILTASLLPAETFSLINNELKLQHEKIRQKIHEEQRLEREANLKKQKLENEANLKRQEQKAIQQEIETRKNEQNKEQLEIILYLTGALVIVVMIGVFTNKWIFFDTEKDFFMTLGLLVSITTLFFMLNEYDLSQNRSLSGTLFYWIVTGISGLLSIWLLVQTYITSIKGNGYLVGTFVYLFKIVFSVIMVLFIFGKIGDITNNKDRRTRANRAPVLAIFALIAIFWKPIKFLLINGDKVREKRNSRSAI